MSCAIATTILEDKAFVAEYTKQSRKVLAEHYLHATKILDEARIDYIRNGYDTSAAHLILKVDASMIY
jgi:hypothetical protein